VSLIRARKGKNYPTLSIETPERQVKKKSNGDVDLHIQQLICCIDAGNIDRFNALIVQNQALSMIYTVLERIHKALQRLPMELAQPFLDSFSKLYDLTRPTPGEVCYLAIEFHQTGVLNDVLKTINVKQSLHAGMPALTIAAACGFVDTAQTLIKAGASVNQSDGDKITPLHYAVSQRHLPMVELLLTTPGIDVNVAAKSGNTPLVEAINAQEYEIVDRLLEAKADVDQGNTEMLTPLALASERNSTFILRTLLQRGADPYREIGVNKITIMQHIEDEGSDVIKREVGKFSDNMFSLLNAHLSMLPRGVKKLIGHYVISPPEVANLGNNLRPQRRRNSF